MWIRKTEEDYKQAGILSNFTTVNLVIAVSLAVLATLLLMAISVVETLVGIVFCFVIFVAFPCIGILLFNDPFFITSFLVFGSAAASVQTDICNKCFSEVQRTDNKLCKCGGKYEPVENWKWVEDKKT